MPQPDGGGVRSVSVGDAGGVFHASAGVPASGVASGGFSPTGVALGEHRQRYFLGAVVMNLVIVAAFVAVLAVAVAVQRHGFGTTTSKAAGNVKCPGLTYLPLMFLLQGTSLCAANLAFRPSRAPSAV
eukprot:gene37504-22668_t